MSVVRTAAFIVCAVISICTAFNIFNNACEDYSHYPGRFWSDRCYYNPDVLLDAPTLIIKHGYPLETHTLTTKDGYILTLFRIPPRPDRSPSNKQPIFLMHGILLKSGIWVAIRNRSLAFELSDQGYDVWLGSIRGSSFSDTHQQYNISSKAYWNFNLDSLAYFDIGTQVQFIKSKTKKQIIYIGYSLGSTLAFLYTAGYPLEAETALAGIIALAPVLYLEDSPLMDAFVEIAGPIRREIDRLQIYGIFYEENINKILVEICSTFSDVCISLMKIFTGKTVSHIRPEDLFVLFSHAPAGTASQVFKHYLQFAETGEITRYDYGLTKNQEYYHLPSPRRYDLSYIKIPVYLLYGQNDVLVSEKSAKMLFRELGTLRKQLQTVPKQNDADSFNHIDFLINANVTQVLFPDVFRIIEELQQKQSNN